MYPSMYPCKRVSQENYDLILDNSKLIYYFVHSYLNLYGKELLNAYEIEDLFSIAVMGICKSIESYNPNQAKLSTWMGKIVFNQLNDLARYNASNAVRTVYNSEMLECCASIEVDPAIIYEDNVEMRLIRKATRLAKLSPVEKKVISLVVKQGVKQTEVAKSLNVSESYISRVKDKALNKIKRQYLKLMC